MAGARVSGDGFQAWQTPPEFLDAVKRRLRINNFRIDLAASHSNKVCDNWYDEATNALAPHNEWRLNGWAWLNPPYAIITPWVAKCTTESKAGACIACLVPASTGANWWRDYVVNDAHILFLNGRLKFVGATNYYPRDLALLLYTPFIRNGSAIWDWRVE